MTTFESMNVEDMAELSGSQKLYEVLSKEHIGFKFTGKQLWRIAEIAGHTLTEGTVYGFIVRAQQKGMIDTVGRAPANKKGKSPQIYKLVSKTAWKFHGPGHGSIAGRNIKSNPPQGELPLLEPMEEGETFGLHLDPAGYTPKSGIAKQVAYTLGLPVVDMNVSESNAVDGETSDGFKLQYDPDSLTDRLVQIAIEVNELENQAVKTLDDFTIDEILDHLKDRLKK